MMALRCPGEDRLVTVGAAGLSALVNVEPGLIVVRWRCRCAHEHWSAVGHLVRTDPERARAAVRELRAEVLAQSSGSSMKTLLGSST